MDLPPSPTLPVPDDESKTAGTWCHQGTRSWALAAVQLCCDRAEKGGTSRSPDKSISLGSVGPLAQSFPLRYPASRGCRHRGRSGSRHSQEGGGSHHHPAHQQDILEGAESAPGWAGGSRRFLSQRQPETSAEAPRAPRGSHTPPAPAVRLPLRAGGRRAKPAARAGREEAAAPALAQNFCSRAGQLSKRSGDKGGTSAPLPQ